MDYYSITSDARLIVLRILRYSGNMGNILFIICSSYFLVNSSRSKKEKALGILLDSMIISIGIFVCFVASCEIFGFNYNFGFLGVLSHLLPDLFENMWFVPAYVFFYLLHPYLNLALRSMGQKKHFYICLLIFFIYQLGGLIYTAPAYSSLMGFVFIYILISYLHLYRSDLVRNKKLNLIVFFSELVIFVATVVLRNLLAPTFGELERYPNIDGLVSIVLLPMLTSLFCLFLNMDFSSHFINKLASCSLFIYCIHENRILREDIRPRYYEYVLGRFGDDRAVLFALICAFGMFVGASALALLYRCTFHRLTQKWVPTIKKQIISLFDSLYQKCTP